MDGGFKIKFEDNSTADCLVLEPPEKPSPDFPWVFEGYNFEVSQTTDFHLAPEIFISDGSKNSIVGKWVADRNGIGGVHHLAYQVDNVQDKVDELKSKGYAEFTSEKPMECPGLVQIFTKPSELTGVIYEFIKRDAQGFCKENVKDLMGSTKEL